MKIGQRVFLAGDRVEVLGVYSSGRVRIRYADGRVGNVSGGLLRATCGRRGARPESGPVHPSAVRLAKKAGLIA